ncbi:DUF3362 domain-containing protein, partial [Pseudoalteromonas sp. S1649]|uniref:DUF3362 domain-containing protein n=1 Tax=Pseudoalteromonas sp. S1649 TaxID=579508 RepID=UPI00110BA996
DILIDQFYKNSYDSGKKQYLIPYFMSCHPGTKDEDIVYMELWFKAHDFKRAQVHNFYRSPMANETTIYHTEMNSLRNIKINTEQVTDPKGARQRRLHKANLRYHDPAGWPMN